MIVMGAEGLLHRVHNEGYNLCATGCGAMVCLNERGTCTCSWPSGEHVPAAREQDVTCLQCLASP